MQELNQQEIAYVSGGYYNGNTIFDALGNLSATVGQVGETLGNVLTLGLGAPIGQFAYNVGEVLTTAVVNLGNGLLNVLGIPANHY